jgi:hypothetical protein
MLAEEVQQVATSKKQTDPVYDPSQIIKLNDKFKIWYHHKLNDWSVRGYNEIFNIENTKDFWDFHNNVDAIGGIMNLHFFLTRDSVAPIYEDPRNRHGGCWSILATKADAYEIWTKLAALLVSEELTNDCENLVTGISINMKADGPVFKIWNTNSKITSDSLLPSFLHRYGRIIYQVHKFHSGYNGR